MVKGQAFPTGLENPSSCRLREPQSRHLERGNLINPLIINQKGSTNTSFGTRKSTRIGITMAAAASISRVLAL
ncbi:hypothetical protein BHE74_00047752 [Ensete ventricosum]|nr:hypothetical protein BHE74_00047752 [Ensete ventricosum]